MRPRRLLDLLFGLSRPVGRTAYVAWFEPLLRTEQIHVVTSRVIVDASPAEVWENVIAFQPLPEPTELWFRAGIAYPTSASITGRGIGATRYCVFSTGSFTERITVWEEPRLLAFDVIEQTEPLRELSPYPAVYADHLDGGLLSRRGEFRITPLGEGRTSLEGSTWYDLTLYPESYWRLWTDPIIRAIHLRVLRQIKTQSEREMTVDDRKGGRPGREGRLDALPVDAMAL